jgi:hypothetical protein
MDKEFWERRWQTGETGWDIGEVSPPLKAYLDQLSDKSIAILIPGAGNAYEAHYLVDKGFTNITILDISETIIDSLKMSEIGEKVNFINADFFAIKGSFDLILEQTFFCAIDPKNRTRYVQKVHELLEINGKLVGLLFNCSFETGPPFGGNTEEYKSIFTAYFNEVSIEPCYNSIGPRAGKELWLSCTRKK